jgi:hypothetical protein
MTPDGNMPGSEMFDERVVTGVFGDDVKAAGGIGSHGAANVIGEGEIKGVLAGGSEAQQLHRDSVLEKLLDQGNIELCLPRA